MRTIMLCGTGRSGKTTLADGLRKRLTESGKRVVYQGSVVREFMRANNINTESEARSLSPNDQFSLQLDLFTYYLTVMSSSIRLAREGGADYFITDRSPYDHLGYVLYTAHTMPVDETSRLINASTWMAKDAGAIMVYFPYPSEWHFETDTDTFRHPDNHKDTIVAALIRYMLSDSWTGDTIDLSCHPPHKWIDTCMDFLTTP